MPFTCYRCKSEVSPRGECACADGICLIHGENREVLPLLQRGAFDVVITDPPYGIGEAAGKNKSRGCLAAAKDFGDSDWDDEPCPQETIEAMRLLGRWQVIFGGNYFQLPPSSCWLVWDKDNGATDFADCELAWTNLDKAVRKIKWRWQGMLQERGGDKKEPRVHPTQKPLQVMRWAIEQAPADCRKIIDPFAGSGTTGRAAKDLGRKCLLIEREEKYVKIAAQRLRQEVLFGAEA